MVYLNQKLSFTGGTCLLDSWESVRNTWKILYLGFCLREKSSVWSFLHGKGKKSLFGVSFAQHTPSYSYLMGPVWFFSRFATVVFSVSTALWVPVKSQLASALDNGRPLAPHLAHSDNDTSVPMVITAKSCQTHFLPLLQNTAFHF